MSEKVDTNGGRMRVRPIFVAVLMIVLFASGIADGQSDKQTDRQTDPLKNTGADSEMIEYADEQAEFSIEYPEVWSVAEEDWYAEFGSGEVPNIIGEGLKLESATLAVASQSLEIYDQEQPPKEWASFDPEKIETWQGKKSVTLGGVEGYLFGPQELESLAEPVIHRTYVLISEERIYIVSTNIVREREKFEEFEATIEAMLDSLQIGASVGGESS